MLPFFRKIRYHLAKNNQFLSYSRYAVGEIVLVVLGILIALQINNWNENSKLKRIELEYLKNLKTEIIANIQEHERDLENAKFSYLHSLEVLKWTQDKFIPKSSDTNSISYLNTYTPYFPNTSSFQSLKSTGIDIISNKSLRDELSKYFDFYSQRLTFWQSNPVHYPPKILDEYLKTNFEVSVTYNIDSLAQLDLTDSIVLGQINHLYDGVDQKVYRPLDLEFVVNDPQFKIILVQAIKASISIIRLHNGSKTVLNKILKQIEREIIIIEN